MIHATARLPRLLVLLLTALLLAVGSAIVVPAAAQAATTTVTRTISTADPTFNHLSEPCTTGSRSTRYKVIKAKLVGAAGSTLNVTVKPTGFQANVTIYQGVFLPDNPIVNCFRSVSGAEVGSTVTYTTPLPPLFEGFEDQTFYVVVAGEYRGDVGSFSATIESTGADYILIDDAPPPPDKIAPVLSLPDNVTQEATSASGAAVTFTATAQDKVSGSRPVTCSPASGSTFALGTTPVSCSATDAAGNKATGAFAVTVSDTTGPVITVPATQSVQATSSSGAAVTYSASANDLVSGSRPVTCAPVSGATFPVGTTPVTCRSTDARGNVGTRTFDVVVREGTLATSGTLSIAGTAKVGRTLTATSTVTTAPASTTSTRWLRNGAPIAGATGTTYELTGDDLGASITYEQANALGGYTTARTTSNAIGPVTTGDLTVPRPTVTGTPTVGETLTAGLGVVSPSGAQTSFEWFSGTTSVGTGATYAVKPGDVGATITAKATATKQYYSATTTESLPTTAVVPGTFATSGDVTVAGTPKVGSTLTATSTVTTSPAASATGGQWFRNSSPIAGATQTTYTLTNDDVSSQLSFQQTRTRDGYVTLRSTSDATPTITGGIITLAKPTLSGTPVVDQVLTATSGTVSPDATVAFVWRVDGKDVATGDTYAVRPADVGKPVTVVATATKTDYDPSSTSSDATAAVTQAVFTTGPIAAFSGVLRVAETLTADEGAVSPSPDSYRYQWLADGKPVAGATSKTFDVTPAQKDATMSVSVTAVRAGYVDAADTSAVSAPVVTNLAPGLTLSPSARELRLGQATTLAWTSEDALTVAASGAWSGAKARSGSETVQPSATGTTTYVLTATNGSGTTTAQVAVPVSLAPTTLSVTSPRKVVSGKKLAVRARGLTGREAYTVRIGGKVVATGTASSAGRVARSVRVPTSLDGGKVTVRVTGSLADRTGSRRLRIVKPRALTISLADRSVRASDDQVVTVRRLRPRERVTVTYDGRVVSPKNARASRDGVYTVSFDVGTAWGPRTVVARGSISRRSTSAGFAVVNRCPQGGYYCR